MQVVFFSIAGLIAIVALFGSIGFFADYTIHKNDPIASSNQECGLMPMNITSMTLTKQPLSQWHWKYDIDGEGYVQMRCPTMRYDLNIYYNDMPVGRTDGKLFSTGN